MGVYLLNGFYKGGDAMAIRERTELLEEQIFVTFCHFGKADKRKTAA